MDFADIGPEFWSIPIYAPEVFPALRAKDITEAERVLGVRLPEEYIVLLKLQNGGYVSDRFDAFPTSEPTSWAEDHVNLRSLAGIGTHHSWPSVTASPGLSDGWGLPRGVVPFDGDGHYFLALDYRESGAGGQPAISWIDTEVGQDLTLAPDFRSFIEGLVPMERFDDPDLITTAPSGEDDAGEARPTSPSKAGTLRRILRFRRG